MDAEKIKQKRTDEQNWILGMYVRDAVAVSVSKILLGNKSRLEYRDKPISKEIEEQHLSEEQKIAGTKALFKSLELMQAKFEKNKTTSNSE